MQVEVQSRLAETQYGLDLRLNKDLILAQLEPKQIQKVTWG